MHIPYTVARNFFVFIQYAQESCILFYTRFIKNMGLGCLGALQQLCPLGVACRINKTQALLISSHETKYQVSFTDPTSAVVVCMLTFHQKDYSSYSLHLILFKLGIYDHQANVLQNCVTKPGMNVTLKTTLTLMEKLSVRIGQRNSKLLLWPSICRVL